MNENSKYFQSMQSSLVLLFADRIMFCLKLLRLQRDHNFIFQSDLDYENSMRTHTHTKPGFYMKFLYEVFILH